MAFEWDGEHSDNPDIYIKMVGSSEVRRLTTTPRATGHPVGHLMAARSRTSVMAHNPKETVFTSYRRLEDRT